MKLDSQTKALSRAEMAKAIIQRHLNAFQQNDLDGLMGDYTNDSILIAPEMSYTGKAAIRGFFADLLPHFPKQATSFILDKTVVSDDLVYILWHGKTPTLNVPFATDTFIISDGKIRQQTFAGQLNPAG